MKESLKTPLSSVPGQRPVRTHSIAIAIELFPELFNPLMRLILPNLKLESKCDRQFFKVSCFTNMMHPLSLDFWLVMHFFPDTDCENVENVPVFLVRPHNLVGSTVPVPGTNFHSQNSVVLEGDKITRARRTDIAKNVETFRQEIGRNAEFGHRPHGPSGQIRPSTTRETFVPLFLAAGLRTIQFLRVIRGERSPAKLTISIQHCHDARALLSDSTINLAAASLSCCRRVHPCGHCVDI